MPRSRSRSRSKSQGRVDPVRRACQLRRFHRDLQAKHPYKKDLIARFDTDTLAAIDLLIGEGTDWQVVLDGETEHDPNWMKKPQSLPSAIVWIKRWAKDAANDQEHVDGGDGPPQVATTDDVDAANLEGPAGSEREQAPATDAVGTTNLNGPAGSSANPDPPLWNLQAGEKARNTFEEDAIARYTSSSTTSHSTAVHKETEAEALERREKDLARKREENALATAAYDEIPQPYLDWLMAYKDASRRQRAMEEAEEQCEVMQARVKLERDALDVATRELEGAKRAVTNAKQRLELAMGRVSGHEGTVLSRDAGAADDDAPLHALRSHRKQRAEAYNTALERCTAAAKEHAAAYDDWTTARDAYQEAEVLEEQRKRAWEQLRGVRRDDVGR
ncbi:hypothetical protein KHU50_012040 [Colletotrichum sp. SAR 10_65]|nr:hypothetical protein KHU50_012040 [Colletotrichum sp. SAR 10_65]